MRQSVEVEWPEERQDPPKWFDWAEVQVPIEPAIQELVQQQTAEDVVSHSITPAETSHSVEDTGLVETHKQEIEEIRDELPSQVIGVYPFLLLFYVKP